MRQWAAYTAGALVVLVVLFGRAAALEREVRALELRLGAAAAADDSARPTRALDFEQRLDRLERELASFATAIAARDRQNPQSKAANANDNAGLGSSDQEILTHVARAQGQVADQQLDFHRERWLDWRDGMVENFAANHGLTPGQADRLRGLFADEIDAWVELLRKPGVNEDPEQFSKDWRAILERTDDTVHTFLTEEQWAVWQRSREEERNSLWPWLPRE